MEAIVKETTCACEMCKLYCMYCPCLPTPHEAQRLIEHGYARRLMLDWRQVDNSRVYIICPAVVGYEKRVAPSDLIGRCTMLTDDELCGLHGKGLKPLEGRLAHHSNSGDSGQIIHDEIARLWNSADGRAVVQLWRQAVNEWGENETILAYSRLEKWNKLVSGGTHASHSDREDE